MEAPELTIDVNDLLIDSRELADMFCLSRRSIEGWRTKGTGPNWEYVRGVVKYRIGDIKTWIVEVNTCRGRYLLTDVSNWLEKQAANVS